MDEDMLMEAFETDDVETILLKDLGEVAKRLARFDYRIGFHPGDIVRHRERDETIYVVDVMGTCFNGLGLTGTTYYMCESAHYVKTGGTYPIRAILDALESAVALHEREGGGQNG